MIDASRRRHTTFGVLARVAFDELDKVRQPCIGHKVAIVVRAFETGPTDRYFLGATPWIYRAREVQQACIRPPKPSFC
jgi:hypothetical protein